MEVRKLLSMRNIYPIEQTTWVSLVIVILKKIGKIRIFVDLPACQRVPYIKHLLERVVGTEAYSFINGFSKYNQISVVLEDQHKTAFVTKFGMFANKNMLLDLISALSTYQ